ncbi:Planctomycete cytochrome C [Aquisphaera giovannonii]|uniref:Planctomycete cytochrome C n=1 Tax=Aquisphaera giovannonii TaxID=406548 RepID=A0A5B9WDW0_9BACT|nr:PSD1 and planctomycete cytochrome C domain-containing protein [Aquisphaera giovannonii]QEH38826.1 Planctomycete cytochrome C [Aquisphaera giovannonii]
MRCTAMPRPGSIAPRTTRLALSAVAAILLAAPAPAEDAGKGRAAKDAKAVDYNRDVRPILSRSCFACHGSDEAKRAKGLRLDLREAAVKPPKGDGDAAIVPGDPDASELVARIVEEDDTLRMPPRKAGPRLSAAEVDILKRWIAGGAEYSEHWALIPPKALPLPKVEQSGWPRNGIDAWILARLEAEGLRPAPEADPCTLLRRASLDLRGLPPSPAELDLFLADKQPGAYERAVDRFLDDAAYGEKWARMWLDLARYADSAGYGSDPLRTIWRYRDWVIDAFNRNLPYDRFTVEQIAGDLLPGATLEQRMATAFHRNTMTNTEGGTDDEEFRVAAVKDRVDTTMQVWMGLTMGCAKCHTHKYDPLTQEEYYKFYAIFDQTADNDQPDESPAIPAPTPESLAAAKAFEARLAPVKDRLAKAEAAKAPEAERKAIRDELARLEKERPEAPTLPVMVELPREKRRVTKLLQKGNFLDPGQVVEPGLPKALHQLSRAHEGPVNRLDLARWLVDPRNPLTGRVAVNRYWAQLFGAGLVATEEDFGTQGELPSHPELLDWLAVRYRELGWDTKAMLRLIVTSSTYRQSSRVSPDLLARDPKNRLLARAPRIRLEAEMVRDQALALSGLLERKVGGPSVFPPQPDGLWQAAFNGQRTWATSQGTDKYRRALYTFWRRTVPYPSMAAFDAPSREICAIKRVRTNTPLQAFVTLNDPVYVEAAQALARRVVREGGSGLEDRVRYALRLCLARPAWEEQVEPLMALYRSERARFDRDAAAAVELATAPLGPLPPGMEPADLAAWTTLANVLLNLDGVLTRG